MRGGRAGYVVSAYAGSVLFLFAGVVKYERTCRRRESRSCAAVIPYNRRINIIHLTCTALSATHPRWCGGRRVDAYDLVESLRQPLELLFHFTRRVPSCRILARCCLLRLTPLSLLACPRVGSAVVHCHLLLQIGG
jgi:hypothetical protein